MPAENLFHGFEFGPEYIARLSERTERPELTEVQRNMADWSEEEFQSFNEEGVALERRLLALLRDGVAAHDDTALAVLEPGEWRTHLDSLDPRLAEYLRDAMLAYADSRMA